MLVLGAGGQVGRALAAALPEATALTRAEFDIAAPAASWTGRRSTWWSTRPRTPTWTAPRPPDGRVAAWRANATGPAALARAAAAHGLTLVHLSSEYVFDGRADEPYPEDAPIAPLSAYGASKAAGDLAVGGLERHYLVRPTWVVGDGRNFVRTMLGLAARGVDPTVVADQIGRPTFAADIAAAIVHLLRSRAPYGTYHVTGGGEPASWADVARAVFAAAGHDAAAGHRHHHRGVLRRQARRRPPPAEQRPGLHQGREGRRRPPRLAHPPPRLRPRRHLSHRNGPSSDRTRAAPCAATSRYAATGTHGRARRVRLCTGVSAGRLSTGRSRLAGAWWAAQRWRVDLPVLHRRPQLLVAGYTDDELRRQLRTRPAEHRPPRHLPALPHHRAMRRFGTPSRRRPRCRCSPTARCPATSPRPCCTGCRSGESGWPGARHPVPARPAVGAGAWCTCTRRGSRPTRSCIVAAGCRRPAPRAPWSTWPAPCRSRRRSSWPTPRCAPGWSPRRSWPRRWPEPVAGRGAPAARRVDRVRGRPQRERRRVPQPGGDPAGRAAGTRAAVGGARPVGRPAARAHRLRLAAAAHGR